jgi:thioredoxin-like negative regulator of GroEL
MDLDEDRSLCGFASRCGEACIRWLTVPALLILACAPVHGEEIPWRTDYNQARHEAIEKGLPLILEFSTENCFWCRKLEETTLHDPAVSRLIASKFVALKVDARRNSVLTEMLRIQSFPTIVLAGPDGKIIGSMEGYQEPERMHEQLQQVVAALTNPEWMVRDYDEASRAIASAEYARAVALLKSILRDDRGSPVQSKARQLLADIEQQAAGRLARAKQLQDGGQATQAIDTLTELLRLYGGTQAATDGGQMLSTLAARPEVQVVQRTRRARELLTQARDDYRSEQYLCCIDRCELLVASYGDLPEGVEAMQLLTEIKGNSEWMRQACDTLSERLGFMYISLAETWIKKGQPRQAIWCLERVVQGFPGTRQAEAAQLRLGQLQGQPNRTTDFKKP